MTETKKRSEFNVYRIFRGLIFLAPRWKVLILGSLFGMFFFVISKKHRRLAYRNLERAYGTGLSERKLKRIARRSFSHFGRTFFDIIKLSRWKRERIENLITVEGGEYLREALDKGKGAILFGAHFGNWEIAPAQLTHYGPLNVIARELDNPRLEEEAIGMRERLGARIIYKDRAAKQVIRVLRKNEMVAILMDQNVLHDQAEFVKFFGIEAATTPSTALFFLRTQSPLLPVFCESLPKGKYRIVISPLIEPKLTGNRSTDVHSITQACTLVIEEWIKKQPEYWFWFHNRWKTRPTDKPSDA